MKNGKSKKERMQRDRWIRKSGKKGKTPFFEFLRERT